MKNKLLFIPLLSLIFTSCSAPTESYEESEALVAHGNVYSLLDMENSPYHEEFIYRDSYFLYDSKTFSKDLALASFGAASTAQSLNDLKSYYSDIGFDDFYNTPNYGEIFKEDGTTLFIAHKHVYDYDLIALTYIGGLYGKEWVSNFDLGLEGNHHGFEKSSSEGYNYLKNYIAEKYANSQIKLWLNGYSRGAILANMTAQKVMNDKLFNIKEKDVFTYAFETPRGILKSNLKGYSNIFNILSNGDIITHVAPEKYGFYREGKDIDIYSSNLDLYLENLEMKKANFNYIVRDGFKEPKDFVNFLLNKLFQIEEENVSISTREKYYENYQEVIKNMLRIFSVIPTSKLYGLLSSYSSFSQTDILALLEEDNLYNLLVTFLDENHIEYNADQLKEDINKIKDISLKLISVFLRDILNFKDNFYGMIITHAPECCYALLKNYSS